MPENGEGPSVWLVRHGETAWSAAGQHTSRTDLALAPAGEREALAVKPLLCAQHFDLVESSPRQRALRTAELAGYEPVIDPDLAEWDYGDLEGLTTPQIRQRYPDWSIWDGPWPGGERPEQVAARADRLIAKVLAMQGGAALFFAHGHILRALAARWLRCHPAVGRLLMLSTGTVCVLGWEHGSPAISHWNLPPVFPPSHHRPAGPSSTDN